MQKSSRVPNPKMSRSYTGRLTKYQPRLLISCIKHNKKSQKDLLDKWSDHDFSSEQKFCNFLRYLPNSLRFWVYTSGISMGVLSSFIVNPLVKKITHRFMPYTSLGFFTLSWILSRTVNTISIGKVLTEEDYLLDGIAGFMFLWSVRFGRIAFPVASFHLGCLLIIGLVTCGFNCFLSNLAWDTLMEDYMPESLKEIKKEQEEKEIEQEKEDDSLPSIEREKEEEKEEKEEEDDSSKNVDDYDVEAAIARSKKNLRGDWPRRHIPIQI